MDLVSLRVTDVSYCSRHCVGLVSMDCSSMLRKLHRRESTTTRVSTSTRKRSVNMVGFILALVGAVMAIIGMVFGLKHQYDVKMTDSRFHAIFFGLMGVGMVLMIVA